MPPSVVPWVASPWSRATSESRGACRCAATLCCYVRRDHRALSPQNPPAPVSGPARGRTEPARSWVLFWPRRCVRFAERACQLATSPPGRANAFGNRQDGLLPPGPEGNRRDPGRPCLGLHAHLGRPCLLVSLRVPRRRLRPHGEGALELAPDLRLL